MTLVKFNRNKENAMMQGVNDIFESIFNDTFFSDRMVSRVPAVNVCETETTYQIELAAPGLKKEDFKLNLERNVLSISVEQTAEKQDKQKTYSKIEFSYTSFIRSFTLPESADHNGIEAAYTDGVLQVTIAKREEAKPVRKQIEIK